MKPIYNYKDIEIKIQNFSIKGEIPININPVILVKLSTTIFSKGKPLKDGSYLIPQKYLQKAIGYSYKIISRHIKFLILKDIIIRISNISNKTFTWLGEEYNKTKYSYAISPKFHLNYTELVIYNQWKEIFKINKQENSSKCKFVIQNKTSNKLKQVFHSVSLNIYPALQTLNKTNKDNTTKTKIAKQLYNIALKDFYINKGLYVNRIYSNFTSIPSFIHPFLYIDGYQIAEIDAKTSQISLISFLTRKYDPSNELHKIIDDPNRDFYEELLYLIHKQDSIKIIVNGKYSKYMKEISPDEFKTKKDVKPHVYTSIFSGFSNGTTISNIIKEYFGDAIIPLLNEIGYKKIFVFEDDVKPLKIIKTFIKLNVEKSYKYCKIKKKPYKPIKIKKINGLASFLQNIEASIWLKTAIELINDGIKVITKHDSLLFDMKYIDVVKEKLIKNYKFKGFEIKEHQLHINIFNKRNEKPFVPEKIKVKNIDERNEIYLNKLYHSEIQKEIKKQTGKTDLTIYTFLNKKTAETFTGIKSEFTKQFNLDKKNLNKVIKSFNEGKTESIKGWIVFKKHDYLSCFFY